MDACSLESLILSWLSPEFIFSYQAQVEPSYGNGPALPRLENPYDTMGATRPDMQFSEDGTYSNPGEVTSELPASSSHN